MCSCITLNQQSYLKSNFERSFFVCVQFVELQDKSSCKNVRVS